MCVGLARLCSWSHVCTGCTYTYTPVSFYRKSMAGYIRLALCRNNASCASSLCRPSPFYSLSLCLCLLVPRQNRGPTATSKNAWGLSFMVCSMACKSCKGSIHEQWSGKGHGHLNLSPMDGKKPKINNHAFLWIKEIATSNLLVYFHLSWAIIPFEMYAYFWSVDRTLQEGS